MWFIRFGRSNSRFATSLSKRDRRRVVRRALAERLMGEPLEDRTLMAFGVPSLVSVSNVGDTSGDSSSSQGHLSGDGRFEVFTSSADNLIPGMTISGENVYLRDLMTGTTSLVSVNMAGTGGDNSFADQPVISTDGEFVAFRSAATNLTPNATLGYYEIFVRDLAAGTTTLVSKNSDGTQESQGYAYAPSISGDGGVVAYYSSAADIVAGVSDPNGGNNDVYAWTRSTGTNVLVSINAAGTASGNNPSQDPVVSRDGSSVAFTSYATDLVSGATDANNTIDVFVRNLASATTRLVSAETAEAAAANASSSVAPHALSADGRYEVFTSYASDLVAGQPDANNNNDVFLRDRQTGTVTLVSVNMTGTGTGNSFADQPVISADGKFVAFRSPSTNLTPNAIYGYYEIFVRDLAAGTTTLVSKNSAGTQEAQGYAYAPSISGDGGVVAYYSSATDIVAGVTDAGNNDVFAWTRSTGTNALVSINAGGTASGNAQSQDPVVSRDGSSVAFTSYATDLVAGATDANNTIDVFVRNLATATTRLVSAETAEAAAANASSSVAPHALSADGRYEVFTSSASDLVAGQPDANGNNDVFLRDRQTGTVTLVSVNMTGTGTGNRIADEPVISADGKFVAFRSGSTDLVPNATYGYYEIFVRDLAAGTTTLVSKNSDGTQESQGYADSPSISGDGGVVAYLSSAADIVAGVTDANSGNNDVFAWTRSTGTNVLVSVNPAGTASGNARSQDVAVSRDGSSVAFTSYATDLVSGATDANNTIDVFVRNLASATTRLVSAETAEAAAANAGSSVAPHALSADGRYEVFTSYASDLVAGQPDANGNNDVFLRDRQTGTVTLVSVNMTGTGTGNSFADEPVISADGKFVAFRSPSTNLTPNAIYGYYEIFVRDLAAGTTTLVSVNSDGTQEAQGYAYAPSISGDGGVVAYLSGAADIVAGVTDANGGNNDVFAWTRSTGTNVLVSVNAAGTATGNAQSLDPVVSRDGSSVAFTSYATDLVSGATDANNTIDVFVRNLASATTRLASVNSDGTSAGNSSSDTPSLSADGNFVAFSSYSSDLTTTPDVNGTHDVFVRNVAAGTTELITINSAGTGSGNSYSDESVISADGKFVAFRSYATNIAPMSVNGAPQIFVRDRVTGTTTLVSINAAGTNGGNSSSDSPAISDDGSIIAFQSYASDLTDNVPNNNYLNVFVRQGGVTTLASVNAAGTASGNNQSNTPVLSGDGSVLSFTTYATDLVAGFADVNAATDVIARPVPGGPNELVSVKAVGLFTGNNQSDSPSISGDGKLVAFRSSASTLTTNDTNATNSDIFVRDVAADTTELITVDSAGIGSGNSYSDQPVITPDGKFVAFRSNATNLDPLDTTGQSQIFVRDRVAGTTTLVSVNADGTNGGNNYSDSPAISDDGATVAFQSYASDLTAVADTNGTQDVFVRRGGVTTLASVNAAGTASGNAYSLTPVLSGNGSVLSFTTNATDLVAGFADVNNATDVIARPVSGGPNELVSVKAAGLFTGNNSSDSPSISGDGNLVAFRSTASTLTTNDTNATNSDIFVRDVAADTTELITVDSAGIGSGNSYSYQPVITPDGKFVAFSSYSTNLDPLDTTGQSQIFVRDRVAGTTTLVSVNADGTNGGNNQSDSPAISDDGTTVAFQSYADNLTAVADTNGTQDVFVRRGGVTTLASVNAAGTASGNAYSLTPVLSGDGSVLSFTTNATDLVAGFADVNNATDVIARPVPGGPNELVSVKAAGLFTGNSQSDSPSISGDGKLVAFRSYASTLTTNDTNGGNSDIFVRDVSADTTELISINSAGTGSGNNTSDAPQITPDGRYVVFSSSSTLLHPLATDSNENIYVRDRVAGMTDLVTISSDGTRGSNNTSFEPSISDNGQVVAYRSYATNLVDGITDDNGTTDVFVRNRATATTTLASRVGTGTASGNNYSYEPFVSADGTAVSFSSYASDLVNGITDANSTSDVFVVKAIGISINNVSHLEGNSGTTAYTFTITLSSPSLDTVSVDYATVDGTATAAGGDYQAVPTTTVTFAPGETVKTVTVLVNGDTTPETNESFFLNLTNPVNADIAVTPGIATILNDDSTVSIGDVSLAEGDAGTTSFVFSVDLSVPSALPVSVDVATSDNSATVANGDYQAVTTTTITFAPGETHKTVTVLVNGDTTAEPNETFFVNLTNLVNTIPVKAQGVGTILNDDATISVSNVTLPEGDSGTTAFTFTLSLPFASTKTVSVNVATADGSATLADGDYQAVPTTTVTFAPGETVKFVTVLVNGDTSQEGDETFSLVLTGAVNATTVGTGTGTILNDDATVSIGDVSLAEGDSGTTSFKFSVDLSTSSSVPVSVHYVTNNGSATVADSDYQALPITTLTFAPGETHKVITVLVNGDATPEGNEYFTVNLSTPSNTSIIKDTGVGTILNDDGQVSVTNVTQLEGNSGTTSFVFTLFAVASTKPQSVDVATADGSAKVSDNDYQAVPTTTVTFAPGETVKTVTVLVNGDTTPELNESFSLVLSNPVNTTIPASDGVGTILNDDSTVSIGDVSLAEGDAGTTSFVFSVDLSVPSALPVSVDVATSDNSATVANGDYQAVTTTTITFAPGETHKTVTVLVNGDTTAEPNETFFVNLTNLVNTIPVKAQGVGTILNDDATISVSNVTLPEGDSGTTAFTFTLSLPFASTKTVSVNVATADGSATLADGDYQAVPTTTVTFAPGETVKFVTVLVNGDTSQEGDETFSLVLTGAVNATTVGTGTGTILNDDATATTVTNLNVQKGAAQRSFVRYVDVNFNQSNGLAAIVATANDNDPNNDRIRLVRRNLDGSNPADVPIGSLVSTSGSQISLNFGPNGITGDPNSPTGDGYYEVQIDIDGNGTFETTQRFFRLLGDLNGDGIVDTTDLNIVSAAIGTSGANLNADANGDGIVSQKDRTIVAKARGRKLSGGLSLNG